MSSLKALTALAFLSLATTVHALDGVWVQNIAGDWSTGFNTNPLYPNAAGDTATLGIPPAGPVAVNLDVTPIVLSALNFQNVNGYTISPPPSMLTNGILFDGASSFLNVTQGNHVINSPITLHNTTLTTNVSSGASIDFFTSITEVMMSSTSNLVVNGPGQMNFICAPSTPPLQIPINGSVLLQNHANVTIDNSALSTIGANCSLFVNSTFTMSGDTFTLNNSGDVQNVGAVAMGQVQGINWDNVLDMNVTQGTINLINSGNISNLPSTQQAFGTVCICLANATFSGGNVNIINTGPIQTAAGTSPCIGSALVVFGLTTISGSTIQIDNTGSLNSNSIFGSALACLNPNPITITGGSLINNNYVLSGATFPATGIFIGPQGTLAGNGFYTGIDLMVFGPVNTSILNNGTVIPGIPDPVPGTMTIIGNYQQTSSGTLLSNISNINSYGQLNVSNTAAIAGNLNLYGLPGIKVKPGDAFKVLTTTNGLTGTFSSVKMLNTPYIPMVFYFPNFVEVILNAGTYPALYQSVFASINHKNIRLEREMQNLHKRFPKETVAPKEVAKNRMFSSRPGPTLAAINLGYQPLAQAAPMHEERQQQRLHREMETCNNNPWNVYFGPIGSVGEVHRKSFNAGFSEWSAGALAGFDYAFEEVGVGLLAEYERLHGNVHRNWGKFNIDQVEVSLYTTYVPQSVPELAVNGIIGGGYEGSHIRRNTGMTGNSVAQGNSNGWEVDALFGLEYAVTSKQVQEFSDNFTFTPMVNLQYVYVNFPKYKEHGAGIFDLSVSHLNAQSLRSTLGAWFNYLWQWTDLSINLEADVGWQREYFDRGSSIKFAGVSSSTLKTRGAGRNTCLAGLDLLFTLYKTYGIEASYDFEWNKMFHDHSFYVGFNIEF